MAMVQGAVYDAVNSIDGGHEPFVAVVPAASPTASMDAAVATAAFRVLALESERVTETHARLVRREFACGGFVGPQRGEITGPPGTVMLRLHRLAARRRERSA
jgi:hypothetical protein